MADAPADKPADTAGDTPLPDALGAPPTSPRLAAALRPRNILPVLAVVLIIAVLWTPEASQLDTDNRLTTYSTSPRAAEGIYEIATRLGWPARRLRTPLVGPLDSNAVYAVLSPIIRLTPPESHALVDAVRRGAGLVYIVSDTGAVEDSLHVIRSDTGYSATPARGAITGACPKQRMQTTITWFQNGVHLYRLLAHGAMPADTVVFLTVDESTPNVLSPVHAPAAAGFPLGRGRVVVLSDPDLLRNDVVRVCTWDVGRRMVAALDWVSQGRRPPLIFDEYHQGFGVQPSSWRAADEFLTETAVGRGIAQGLVAGLVLLLALGVRPIAPRDVPRIERRSPLEHVDALARAYERIGATRIAARRLAAGLRRRHGRGAWSVRAAGSGASAGAGTGANDADERFLAGVVAGRPALAGDAARILSAEHTLVTPAELLNVADAVEHIDQVFPSPKT